MKYALISVFDKNGLIEFVEKLIGKGYKILASGGTYKVIQESGIEVMEVAEFTQSPELFDGRVKTLNPKIHGGILYKRDNAKHQEQLKNEGLVSIDMVVCNLYPFEETYRNESPHSTIVENIDIGGPSMIRAAAKNYQDVCVVVDPQDYLEVIENHEDVNYRQILAAKAFQLTAQYDAIISDYFNNITGIHFPELLTLTYRKKQNLRYGENPHQKAAYYEQIDQFENLPLAQLHGKELSYNNINDLTGALDALNEFKEPTAVAVKHANPCAIASASTINEAYNLAFNADPISIFGGIVALNREVDEELANKLAEIFLEIIIAPSYTEKAFKILSKKKNIRLLEMKNTKEQRSKTGKFVLNGLLIQDKDSVDAFDYEVMSKRQPTPKELLDLNFAWNAAKHIDSNGIVIAKNNETLSLGHGEVRRIWALEKALDRSVKDTNGAVMASDGFFFEDTVEACVKGGITAIVQPGGSIHDPRVIDLCDQNNIALIFTKVRHFKH